MPDNKDPLSNPNPAMSRYLQNVGEIVTAATGGTFQARVEPWMAECFGPRISADTTERNDRFIEEALELVQAGGMPKEHVLALVDYTYGRPVGDLPQEVGGVMVTLAALCLAQGVDMHVEAETELARISTPDMIAKIRAKQESKPRGSPLPVAVEQPAWRVGEYWSSSRPGKKVLVLSTGGDIEVDGQHKDFIRWVSAPAVAEDGERFRFILATVNQDGPECRAMNQCCEEIADDDPRPGMQQFVECIDKARKLVAEGGVK